MNKLQTARDSLRKNKKKGMTLVEIIVVLVIIAILMAALAPVMIGWINEARETTIRTEGRTVLLALNTTSVEHRAVRPSITLNRPLYVSGPSPTKSKFDQLMLDSGIPVTFTAAADPAAGATAARGLVGAMYVDANGIIVGIKYANTIRRNADPDGAGAGWLLIGISTPNLLPST
jgi:prepilin-type N-terminal cleavage/methylation domain-containing protein